MSSEGMADKKRCEKMLDLWRGELDTEVFLYDMSELSSHIKMSCPKIDVMVDALREHGKASKTHMCPTSFKTDLSLNDVIEIYQSASPDNKR